MGEIASSDTNDQLLGHRLKNVTGQSLQELYAAEGLVRSACATPASTPDPCEERSAHIYADQKQDHPPRDMAWICAAGGIVSPDRSFCKF